MTLTPDGLAAFDRWVASPVAHGRDFRLEFLAKLYFAMQSRPGVRTWTIAEMADWQRSAGLRVLRAKRLRTAPGWVHQAAVKR